MPVDVLLLFENIIEIISKCFFFCNALVKCHNSKIVFVKSNTAFNSYYFLLKLLKMCSFKIQLKPPKYPRRNISWQMTTIAKKYK